MTENIESTKISVYRKDDTHWHVILQHEDGREEISDNSFRSKEECEAAIMQYVKDRKGQLQRFQ
jgi:hypothetical protein